MSLSDFSIPGLNLLKNKLLTHSSEEDKREDNEEIKNPHGGDNKDNSVEIIGENGSTQENQTESEKDETQQSKGLLKKAFESLEHASEGFVHALEQDNELLDQDETTERRVADNNKTDLDTSVQDSESTGKEEDTVTVPIPVNTQSEDDAVYNPADQSNLQDEKSLSVEEEVPSQQSITADEPEKSAFELALAGHVVSFDDEQGKFHVQDKQQESTKGQEEEQENDSTSSSSEEEDEDDDGSSDSSSSSSSSSDEEEDGEIAVRTTVMEDSIDENGGGGGDSPVRSKNEQEDQLDDSYLERLHIPPETPLELLGQISHVVENNTVIIRGVTSGEIRVLDEDTVVVDNDYNILGRVYETLGRVEEPYYSLKFATIKPVEEKKFRQRTNEQVFYVSEKANIQVLPSMTKFVLTEQLRALKGSDASNIHDEEISESDAEFSSDEAEQLYKARRKSKRKEATGGLNSRQQSNNINNNNNNNNNKRYKTGTNSRSKPSNDQNNNNNLIAADARQRAYTSMPSRYGNGTATSSGLDSGDLYTPLSRPSSSASVNRGNEHVASPYPTATTPLHPGGGWTHPPQQQYYQHQQQEHYPQGFYPPLPQGFPMGVPQQQQYMGMDPTYMTAFQHQMMSGNGYPQQYYQQQQQVMQNGGSADGQIYQQVQRQLDILRRSSSSQGDKSQNQ